MFKIVTVLFGYLVNELSLSPVFNVPDENVPVTTRWPRKKRPLCLHS